jgi:hypothetical protein
VHEHNDLTGETIRMRRCGGRVAGGRAGICMSSSPWPRVGCFTLHLGSHCSIHRVRVQVEYGLIKSMKEVLLDMVAQKRPAPEARKGVEDWRQAALKTFAENRTIQKPWARLQLLDLSHNQIAEFDPGCLE